MSSGRCRPPHKRPPPRRASSHPRTPTGARTPAFILEQQVVAPLHDGAQSLLAGRAVRAPPVNRRKRSSSRSAAAARGWPSPGGGELDGKGQPIQRVQRSSTLLRWRPRAVTPPVAAARSAKSSRASVSASGGTGQMFSPPTLSASRLVARIRSCGQWARTCSTTLAASSMRCSQLSTTRSVSRSPSCSTTRSSVACRATAPGVRPERRWLPRPPRPQLGDHPGAPARRGRCPCRWQPAPARAQPRLPAPPGPTIVTRRWPATSSRRVARSRSRPMKLLSAGLRFDARRSARARPAGGRDRGRGWLPPRPAALGRGRGRAPRRAPHGRAGTRGEPRPVARRGRGRASGTRGAAPAAVRLPPAAPAPGRAGRRAGLQVGIDAVLEDTPAELLESSRFPEQHPVVLGPLQRRSSPPTQRLAQRRGGSSSAPAARAARPC